MLTISLIDQIIKSTLFHVPHVMYRTELHRRIVYRFRQAPQYIPLHGAVTVATLFCEQAQVVGEQIRKFKTFDPLVVYIVRHIDHLHAAIRWTTDTLHRTRPAEQTTKSKYASSRVTELKSLCPSTTLMLSHTHQTQFNPVNQWTTTQWQNGQKLLFTHA